jgi:DNA invertase Pin-like site-specific DNA recombinase
MMTTVGYARVSSLGQDLAVQLQELKGCDRVFNEKRSGVDRTSLAMIGFGESISGTPDWGP